MPIPERLMGFEPTTFCMASRTRGDAVWPDLPANQAFRAKTGRLICPAFNVRSREFAD
jgi:hypothetical protein